MGKSNVLTTGFHARRIALILLHNSSTIPSIEDVISPHNEVSQVLILPVKTTYKEQKLKGPKPEFTASRSCRLSANGTGSNDTFYRPHARSRSLI
jgi:hypothetical protein